MSKNPITNAIEVQDGPIKKGDMVVYKLKKTPENERDWSKNWRLYRIIDETSNSRELYSLFFNDSFYVQKVDADRLKKLNWKRVRKGREVRKGDKITTKDWFTTTVIDVMEDWIITYMWGEKWVNTLYYKNDFFRTAVVKWEWRFEDEEDYAFDLAWINKYLPNKSYMEWYEDKMLKRISEFKVGDHMMRSEEWNTIYKCWFENAKSLVFIDTRDNLDIDSTIVYKTRCLFIKKSDTENWYYKPTELEIKNNEDHPRCFSKKTILEQLWLK